MAERIDVVVVGGGQAGLATSHELSRAGLEHVVLERGRVAESWRGRWDSFCLVTPNWSVKLPGGEYDGDDPDGYLPREELVAYLEGYARGLPAPIREEVDVSSLEPAAERFRLRTTIGAEILARSVVVATGAYQWPHRPAAASSLPPDLLALDAQDYRNPQGLPDGQVLVIGSGQTGCQLAEELRMVGREVFLACGRSPWSPRRLGDRDMFWWSVETGFLDQPLSALPDPSARLFANLQGTGRGGGHDLHYRTLRADGVTLLGHFIGAEGRRARFAPDLAETVAWGDERYRQFAGLIRKLVEERDLPMPGIPEPDPFEDSSPEELDLTGFGAVLFAGGFRPDYRRWVRVPGAFDDLGFPVHADGASSASPGLYFVGVHFLRTRKSSLLFGIGEDAAIVAGQVAVRHGAA